MSRRTGIHYLHDTTAVFIIYTIPSAVSLCITSYHSSDEHHLNLPSLLVVLESSDFVPNQRLTPNGYTLTGTLADAHERERGRDRSAEPLVVDHTHRAESKSDSGEVGVPKCSRSSKKAEKQISHECQWLGFTVPEPKSSFLGARVKN